MPMDAILGGEDGSLAIHPDGDALIVFDSATGAGAECCCGESKCPGCSGDCCFNTGMIVTRCGSLGCAPAMKGRCFRITVQADETHTYSRLTGTGCKNVQYYWHLRATTKFATRQVGSVCVTGGERCCESAFLDTRHDENSTPCNPQKLLVTECGPLDLRFGGFPENAYHVSGFFDLYHPELLGSPPLGPPPPFCTGRVERVFGGDGVVSFIDQTLTRGCVGDVMQGTFSYSTFIHQPPFTGNPGFEITGSGTASWTVVPTDDCPPGLFDGGGEDSAPTSGDFI